MQSRVKQAILDFQQGKMVILVDHPDRENEGDLILPAECITAEKMNFMIRQGTGIVCLSLTKEKILALDLPMMLPPLQNTSYRETPFTVSIDAKDGITTGVSAMDRTKTILTAIADDVMPDDLARPGHIFPLQAKSGGVLERQGHTEGALDLARLAGFKPAAVLCEIMNPDGTMAHGQSLHDFAKQHNLTIISIDDLITYRLQNENFIEEEAEALLPLEHYGNFKIKVIKDNLSKKEHIILIKEKQDKQSTLVRIHSSCATGDLFSSLRCDCHHALHYALKKISEEGGLFIYLNQEGRGIGLLNKIKAYALQEKGLDTVEANVQLGLPIDSREYDIAANILRNLKIDHIRLMTNNPHKINQLEKLGIKNIIKESMPHFINEHNYNYLKTKKEKLNHDINL
jgi:3,4-dihydroxy 2-butanone 4-phosphate synthase/GTP cyclohydrolase II